MSKSPDAFRTISEVAEWLGIQTHVLRFWESKFTQIKPVKRAGGRRYYRPADMLLIGGIKRLLHDDGLTTKGVQKILREKGVSYVSELSQGLDETAPEVTLDHAPAPAADIGTVVSLTQPNMAEPSPARKDDGGQFSMDLGAPTEAEPVAVIEATEQDVPEPAESANQEPEPPRPIVVDVQDPPPADALSVAPGVLGRLARLDGLNGVNRAELATLLRDLKDWHDRATNLRDG